MGQSTGLLIWCLNTTPPSVRETGKGAVLVLEAAAGIASLVRDHMSTELHCPEVCSTNILMFLELACLLALFQCPLWIGIFRQTINQQPYYKPLLQKDGLMQCIFHGLQSYGVWFDHGWLKPVSNRDRNGSNERWFQKLQQKECGGNKHCVQ